MRWNRVEKEFSRFSEKYPKYNLIQEKIAKYLISKIDFQPHRIVDIGAGTGTIYKNINWKVEKFLALDFSKKMLELHPSSPKIEKLIIDFDSPNFWNIEFSNYDIAISNSALQWSRDIGGFLNRFSEIDIPFYFSIFTSRTFQELHQELEISSPIYSKSEILEFVQSWEYEVLDYKMEFSSRLEAVKYIKNSGVSGGVQRVPIAKLREFLIRPGKFPLSFQAVLIVRR